MKSGWFKMYRSIVDWEWFKEHDMTCFFLYCLSNANLQDKMWRGVYIKRGQLLVSRSTMCRELGIEERRYRTIISRLQKSGEIDIDTSGGCTLITIVNWERYQADYVDEAAIHSPEIDQSSTSYSPSNVDELRKVTTGLSITTAVCQSQQTPATVQGNIEDSQNRTLDLFFESSATTNSQSPKKKKTEVDCEFVVKLYHNRCPDFPKVLKITDRRKTRIRLWFEDIGSSYERVQEIFDRCSSSKFLKGDNNRCWKADFDWITNKANWVKILEGKYDEKEPVNQINNHETQSQDRYVKRRGADSTARSAEDYTDSF